jgi:AsmA protein
MAFALADTMPDAETQVSSGVVMLPRDLDIDFDAAIKKVTFEGLDINDLKGKVTLHDGVLVLSKTAFELIGCNVKLDATYSSISPTKAFFDFQVDARDFDIKRAYNEVAMIKEMVPSAGKAEGIVSLDYAVKGRLGADMMPVLPSLEGGGVVSVKKVKVYGLKLFNDISKGTEKEALNNPDLSKVDIKSTIKNNTVTLEQFKFKVKGIRVRIEGTTTFDSRLNLKVRIGLGPFGIIGIPMKITGPMDNLKIKYGKGKEKEEDLTDSDYADELPKEMLERIKNAKEDPGDEDEPEPPK